ncbi:hypothetical protein DICPUDRAFT_38252, partial [Dictyostelium purpureum]
VQCIHACNNGGKCNTTIGECICTSNYGGDDCTTPIQYISSIQEAPVNGGTVYLFGWFGIVHSEASVFIGSKECNITNINTTNVDCTIDKGVGEKPLNMTQNGYSFITTYHFSVSDKTCPNNCSGIGTCNTKNSECSCPTGYSGFDCSTKDNGGSPGTSIDHDDLDCSSPIRNPNENTSPKSNSTVNPDGSTTVVNENTAYNIYITSLLELDYSSAEVKRYPLENNWVVNQTNKNNEISSEIYFSQTLKGTGCQVVLLVQEIKKESNYSFAGIDFKLEPGSIKVSVSITNYRYQSPLNTLQLQMISNVSSNTIDCNTKSTESTTSLFDNQLLNYITIRKDNKVLYGRFINRAMLDERPRTITTSLIANVNESITIGINMPHCNQCHIDPDFSVLVSPDFKSNCEGSSKKSYVIPVAVVVSVVGVALIVCALYIVYKKKKALYFKKRLDQVQMDGLDN